VQVEQTLDSEIAAKDLHAKAWEAWFNWLSASGEVKQWLGE
jgi:cobalt-zinc-cadmium efflux system outer membrane protein